MDKKNLLLMVPSLQQGGQERICAMTAELLKDDYHVILVLFDGEHNFYTVKGVKIININLPARPGKFNKIIQVIRRARKVKKIKKQFEIDVSYSFGSSSNIVNVYSKTEDMVILGLRGYGILKDRMQVGRIFPKADILLCCSQELAYQTKNMFQNKTVMALCNPVDINRIEELAKIETESIPGKTIMTMGRIADVKGYWHLLKAFAIIEKKMSNVRFVHIGEGDADEYKVLAKNLGISNKVAFLGVRDNPFPYLKQANVYVLSSCHEGFPNALIEAMSLKVPVIATNCLTGPAEILSGQLSRTLCLDKDIYYAQYGILVPEAGSDKDLDPDTILLEEELMADAIITLLTDEELQKNYSEKGYQRAVSFSVDSYTKKVKEILG